MALPHVAGREPVALFLLPTVVILPWIGLAPAALLAWASPLAAFLWAALAAGLALVAIETNRSRWGALPGVHHPLVVFAIVAVVLAVVHAIIRLPLNGDEPHYLVISSSILDDGDVELANDYDLERYRSFYQGSLEPRHTVFTRAGRHYPVHGLGTSVLVAPAFAFAGVDGARATMLLICAVGAALLWSAVRSATGSPGAAWVSVAVLVLQVPFATQSAQIYPDAPAAAVACAVLWTMRRIETSGRVSILEAALLGLCLSSLPWLHIRLSIVSAAFGIGVLLLAWRRRLDANQLAWFLVPPFVAGALWVASIFVMFETLNPLATLYHSGAFSSIPLGVIGLLTDQEFGLLPYAPAVVFGIAGLWNRSLPVTSAASIAAILGTLVTTSSHGWWGGTNSPARFLVPVLPMLACGAGYWWSNATRALRHACGVGIVIGATLLALGAYAGGGRYLVNSPDGRGTLFCWLSDSIDMAAALPSFFRTGADATTEALLAAVWVVTSLALLAGVGLIRRGIGGSWCLAAWAAVVWSMAAVTLSFAISGRSGHTADRSQFAVLSASTRPWLPTGMASLRPSSAGSALRRLAFQRPSEETLAMVPRARFPAATYRLEPIDSRDEQTTVSVRAGRSEAAVWQLTASESSGSFTLAAPVRRLRLTAAERTPPTDLPLLIRPIELHPTSETAPAEYVRSYGPLVVYTADVLGPLEAEGFWLWAGRQTRFVVADLDGAMIPLRITLRVGAAPVSFRILRGGWSADGAVDAGAVRELLVPDSEHGEPFTVEVTGARNPQGIWATVTTR